MSILERLAELEVALFDDLMLHDTSRERLHRYTMLVAQEAWADGHRTDADGEVAMNDLYTREKCQERARIRFPLPPKSVLREVLDPHANLSWRWNERGLEYCSHNGPDEEWRAVTDTSRVFDPTRARVRLWAELLAHPHTLRFPTKDEH